MCEVLHDCQQLDFSKFWNYVNWGSFVVYLKKSSFQKCPKCIITYNYVFLSIIHNTSVSGVFKFPIFEEISISIKFRQNLFFFWKIFSVLLVFAVLRIFLSNTYVYLQYASSSTWFRAIWIFLKFWNFVKAFRRWRFSKKLGFTKNIPNALLLIILSS
jgi:hypothetical protein